jgi:hypothetical protein
LVVESVTPNTAAALSGFQPGDLLLTWTFRPHDPIEDRPQTGTLDTPFDLIDLFVGKAPRGELTFEGMRQGQALSWTYRSTGSLVFGLQVRPVSSAGEAVPTEPPRRAAWFRLRSAEVAAAAGDTAAADRFFGEASEILLRASDPPARAAVLRAWGQFAAGRDTARARELYEGALALERQRDGAGLSAAYILGILADYADREGDLAAAERAWLERLGLLEKLAPDSASKSPTPSTSSATSRFGAGTPAPRRSA